MASEYSDKTNEELLDELDFLWDTISKEFKSFPHNIVSRIIEIEREFAKRGS